MENWSEILKEKSSLKNVSKKNYAIGWIEIDRIFPQWKSVQNVILHENKAKRKIMRRVLIELESTGRAN